MSLRVRVTPAAEQDLIDARSWYLEEAPHVEPAFEREVAEALERIAERPAAYQIIEDPVRRVTLRRFPYAVFYQVLPEWIEVVAVVHQARNPAVWRRR